MADEMKRAKRMAERLADAYGDTLRSVVLYGSAARGEYRAGISDLNLLVLLRDVDPATLARGSAALREWVEEGNAAPVVLGADEWRDSADVFAIEYADIRDAHLVLRGDDPFAELVIEREHLRLQTEREFRQKQLALRGQYLLRARNPEELAAVLAESFPAFMALYRAILRLAGREIPAGRDATIHAVAECIGIDPFPLLEVHALRERAAPRIEADDPTAVGYLRAVDAACAWLDAHQ